MRGLKIQDKWIQLILNGQKTMEVRSLYFKIKRTRIALGNSDTGNVEGYATVTDVIKIPYSQISKYENQHLATKWLIARYSGRDHLYGYILRDMKRETKLFPYQKSPSICFNIKAEGTP